MHFIISVIVLLLGNHYENNYYEDGNINNTKFIMQPAGLQMIFYDTSKFVVLNTTDAINFAFNKPYKPNGLNNTQLEILEKVLIHSVDSFNIEGKKRIAKKEKEVGAGGRLNRHYFLIDTAVYKFQLIPVIDDKNQQLIWANAFCSNENNWRNEIVSVKDGGICYFKLLYNFTTKKVIFFRVNGDA